MGKKYMFCSIYNNKLLNTMLFLLCLFIFNLVVRNLLDTCTMCIYSKRSTDSLQCSIITMQLPDGTIVVFPQ